MGVTEPAHTQAELAGYWQRSTEMLTIDGHTRTRYQWTQQMRRIESAIRGQKDIAVAAKAAGDMTARREVQKHINALQQAYNRIAEAAELAKRTDLMTVSGFRAVKATEALKHNGKSDIIQVAGQTINTRIRAQKQQEHIWGSKAFIQRTEAAQASSKSLPSAFYQDVDVEKLVKANMGRGTSDINKQGVLSEFFDAGKNVGWTYLEDMGAYETTSRVCIRYSKNGWHAFPVKKLKER